MLAVDQPSGPGRERVEDRAEGGADGLGEVGRIDAHGFEGGGRQCGQLRRAAHPLGELTQRGTGPVLGRDRIREPVEQRRCPIG